MNEYNEYIMAIDSGTTSCRTLIIDKKAKVIAVAQKEFTQFFPKDGWVEHDANEIYGTQFSTIVQVLQQNNIKPSDIKGIGITNQRETIVLWDKETGIPVYNAIVWQDKRTNEYCKGLKKDPKIVDKIRDKTGLIIDPYFSGTKIKWILDNVEGVRKRAEEGKILFGTIDTWLIWKLTNGKVHATDQTNASRTLIYNIVDLKWDEELLKLFNIPKSILPEVKNSIDEFGIIDAPLITGVPIYAAIGDQQSSLFGHRCTVDSLKGTYGTGAFLVLNTGKKIIKSNNGLLTTIALAKNGVTTYALEGSIFIAGNVFKWLKEELHLIQEYDQIDYYMNGSTDTMGAMVVPYFVGVGAPYWNGDARGIITGLTRAVKRKHIIKAAAQSIAFQTNDIFKAFEIDYQKKVDKLFIDGGVTGSNNLMQFQSDLLGIPIYNPISPEVTALGVSYLVGLKIGIWKSEQEIDDLIKFKDIYKPNMKQAEKETLVKQWNKAVNLALKWEKE